MRRSNVRGCWRYGGRATAFNRVFLFPCREDLDGIAERASVADLIPRQGSEARREMMCSCVQVSRARYGTTRFMDSQPICQGVPHSACSCGDRPLVTRAKVTASSIGGLDLTASALLNEMGDRI